MFGIKKDENNPVTNSDSIVPPPPISDDVYVMPDQFHPQQNKKSSNKPLIISLIVLVLVLLATATYFFFDMWQKNNNQPVVAVNSVNDQNENTENIDEIATSTDDALNSDLLNATTTEEVATSTVATTTDPGIVLPIVNTSTPPQLSSDSDNDGLTDAEESIIGSSPIKQDTDGDGFFDGAEILNGYNPLIAGSDVKSKIVQAAFIATVNTNFAKDNFRTITIKDWPQNLVPTTNQDILTTNTGEIIKISVKDNHLKLSAANWYAQASEVPQAVVAQLRPVSAGSLTGVFSANGLEAYLTDPSKSKIYIFEYIMDASAPMRYPSIFNIMIKNFQTVSGNQSASVNNNTASSTGQTN